VFVINWDTQYVVIFIQVFIYIISLLLHEKLQLAQGPRVHVSPTYVS